MSEGSGHVSNHYVSIISLCPPETWVCLCRCQWNLQEYGQHWRWECHRSGECVQPIFPTGEKQPDSIALTMLK